MQYKKEQKHNFTVLTSILISICDTLLSFWNQFHSVSTGWLKSLNPVAQSGADSTLETRMVTFHIQSSYLFSSGTAEAFLFTLQIPTILKPLAKCHIFNEKKDPQGLKWRNKKHYYQKMKMQCWVLCTWKLKFLCIKFSQGRISCKMTSIIISSDHFP